MRTSEECYEYVLARCGELAAQRKRKRRIALSAAVPVCGVILAGSVAGLHSGKPDVNITSGDAPAVSSEIEYSDSINKPVENPPKYDNKLNIGEVEVADFGPESGICVPPLFVMSRDEILEHFGLSTDFGLSSVVPELHETIPRNPRNLELFFDGTHGLHRVCYTDKNGNDVWGEVYHIWDNDEFRFENADGSQLARVIFQRKYDDQEVIPVIRSNIYTALEDGSFSTKPFYELPSSNIAGVEMRIAKRSIGGYYAEFSTDELCVGLLTLGISEENTVAILEYLAEYVGAAKSVENNDIQIEGYSVSYPLVMY